MSKGGVGSGRTRTFYFHPVAVRRAVDGCRPRCAALGLHYHAGGRSQPETDAGICGPGGLPGSRSAVPPIRWPGRFPGTDWKKLHHGIYPTNGDVCTVRGNIRPPRPVDSTFPEKHAWGALPLYGRGAKFSPARASNPGASPIARNAAGLAAILGLAISMASAAGPPTVSPAPPSAPGTPCLS